MTPSPLPHSESGIIVGSLPPSTPLCERAWEPFSSDRGSIFWGEGPPDRHPGWWCSALYPIYQGEIKTHRVPRGTGESKVVVPHQADDGKLEMRSSRASPKA
jgi:hypothetical protein